MTTLTANHELYFPTNEHLADYLDAGGMVQNMHDPDKAYRVVLLYDNVPVLQVRSLATNHWRWTNIELTTLDDIELHAIQPLGPDPDRYGSGYKPRGRIRFNFAAVPSRFHETFFQIILRVLTQGPRGQQVTSAANRNLV